jgi:hypothetical protein
VLNYLKYHVSTEIDRVCSMYGEKERCVQGFSGQT